MEPFLFLDTEIKEYSAQETFYHLIENHTIIHDSNYPYLSYNKESIKDILDKEPEVKLYFSGNNDFGLLASTRLY